MAPLPEEEDVDQDTRENYAHKSGSPKSADLYDKSIGFSERLCPFYGIRVGRHVKIKIV
jgi:hypothetical protein